MEVQVQSAFEMAMRAANQCGSDVGLVFSFFLFFIVGLSGGEAVHLDVNFE